MFSLCLVWAEHAQSKPGQDPGIREERCSWGWGRNFISLPLLQGTRRSWRLGWQMGRWWQEEKDPQHRCLFPNMQFKVFSVTQAPLHLSLPRDLTPTSRLSPLPLRRILSSSEGPLGIILFGRVARDLHIYSII